MFAPNKMKLSLIALIGLLLYTVSCDIQPYIPEPAAPPKPTNVPEVQYIVALKKSDSRELINTATFQIGSKSVNYKNVKVDDEGYHLLCTSGDGITIWVEGFFMKQTSCPSESATVEILLDRYQLTDNADYTWVGSGECARCHSEPGADLVARYHDEYNEWRNDPHSRSFSNPYFQSVYLGTNGHPGFLADYPADFGNCAFCHVPAVLDPPQREADLKNFFYTQPAPAMEGVTCDVCHKVVNVNLQMEGVDKDKPYHDRPGVLAYNFLRPDVQTERIYVGPRMDANLGLFSTSNPAGSKITYSPVYAESEFCAPCHYGKFWDMEVYNSYGEWMESAYSQTDKDTYKSCQDCHMKTGYLCDVSEINQVSQSEITHNMTVEDCMLKNAASMDVNASHEKGKDRIAVTVTLTNENAGHNFPTDSPLRHLILAVEAKDQFGNNLYQVEGDVIPLWGGLSNYGKAGKIFANMLIEENFENRPMDISPTIAYWNKTKQAWKNSDNRLKAKFYNSENKLESVPDTSHYYFAAPFPVAGKLNVNVTVRLFYRYEFFDLKLRKGWNRQDIQLIEWTGVVE